MSQSFFFGQQTKPIVDEFFLQWGIYAWRPPLHSSYRRTSQHSASQVLFSGFSSPFHTARFAFLPFKYCLGGWLELWLGNACIDYLIGDTCNLNFRSGSGRSSQEGRKHSSSFKRFIILHILHNFNIISC